MRILFILLIMPFSLFAQVNIDSLWDVWNDPNQADTNRLKAIHQMAWDGFLFSKPDSAFELGQLEFDFAEEHNLPKFQASALNMQGVSFAVRGNPSEALEYFNNSLTKSEEIGDSLGIALSVNSIGVIYKQMGEFEKAMKNFSIAYEVQKRLGNTENMTGSLVNMGVIYNIQGNYLKALDCFYEGRKLQEESGSTKHLGNIYLNIGTLQSEANNPESALENTKKSYEVFKASEQLGGMATALHNMAGDYEKLGDLEKSEKSTYEALAIREKMGDRRGIAYSLANIGRVYLKKKDYDEAIKQFEKALKIQEELNLKSAAAKSLSAIGIAYYEKEDFQKAYDYGLRSFDLAKEVNGLEEIQKATEVLWATYKEFGMYEKALNTHLLYVKTLDSLNNENDRVAIIRQDYQYEYEKQAAADSIKAAEEAKVKDAELAAEHAENVRRKQQSYFLYGGLALALVFGGFIFNRYKVTSQQKEIISEQKEEVDKAYVELEDKNQKILDSITYAKRIQSAILPPAKVVKEYLHDSFIIYLPKDVVAGDFYWLEAFAKASASKGVLTEDSASEGSITDASASKGVLTDDSASAGSNTDASASEGLNTDVSASEGTKILFAAADCTGHGVPGAMVSVVCNNGLNRSVREHGLTDPGKILDKTREIVVKEFEKSEEEVKDGMDIALCVLDGNKLEYAGAHNPLVIVRKNVQECEVIKPNKQPIGQFDNPQPYTTHKLELNEGDSIYLFSDGFQDQFGGPKGKKFMISRFKKLLVEVSKEPMNKQREMILEAFNDWKGNEEQVDDVCVIGVRV